MTTATASKDVTGEVRFLARELKTPVIGEMFAVLGDQAREEGWSHEEYLAAVLGRQVASRAVNGTKLRVSAARFPQVKTLDDFSFTHLPSGTAAPVPVRATHRQPARGQTLPIGDLQLDAA